MLKAAHQVLCVSWEQTLAVRRRLLLRQAGYQVVSAVGEHQARAICRMDADLLVFGHSVPQERKREFIQVFRKHCPAPVLSLLCPGQLKLPEATFGVESLSPEGFMQAIQRILPRSA